nr:hypothetical protein [Pedobacter sp. ASV19]
METSPLKNRERLKKDFYQMLGELFYAVASADKKIRREEVEAMDKIVKTEWIAFDDSFDRYGTDFVMQIGMAFYWLAENKFDPKNAVADFGIFKKDHPEFFTETVKILILKTAEAMACAFAGKNKSELVILSQIECLLNSSLEHGTNS